MATQLHFAHSSVFSGVGVLSGIPYWCMYSFYKATIPLLSLISGAADNIVVALTSCMKYPSLISTQMLYAAIKYAAALYSIDDPHFLKNSKVRRTCLR